MSDWQEERIRAEKKEAMEFMNNIKHAPYPIRKPNTEVSNLENEPLENKNEKTTKGNSH